jgi:hypothetical protein
MWKCPFFVGFLNDLLEFPAVGQVILINNNPAETPVGVPASHHKLRIFMPGPNIGVNPAWNLGVAEARYSKICIANDDVVFDQKMFKLVDTVLGPDSGVVGICPGVKDFNQPPFVSGIGRVVPWTGQHTYGFGCLMFVHKKSWQSIPPGLDIYYGDNYIFDLQLARKKTNYLITNMIFKSQFAATTSDTTLTGGFLERETAIYNRIKLNLT